MSAPSRSPFLSGYVEGYYGRLFTFAERLGIVRKLRAIGAGHYLYAPKEDLYHRRAWRKPYPAAWKAEFRDFVAQSKKLNVTVVPGIAPGQSFRYRKPEDFGVLARKLFSLTDLGCTEAALLMDDIPVGLPEADRKALGKSGSLGEAHGLILQKLWPLLQKRGMRRLWFCPTVYSDFFAPEGLARSAYLKDIAPFLEKLGPGIAFLWTGRAIVSPDYAAADLSALGKVMGKAIPSRPVLWDNLYANDYCPGKIFLGPFRGRPASLRKSTGGMLLNPTGLYHTDLFLLDILGGFLRGLSPVSGWRKAVRSGAIPREFLTVAPLLASPFTRLDPKGLTPAKVRSYRAALKPLIWDWKSPLQREWYPYLYALDGDLRLLETGKSAPDEAWVRKKYSVIVAGMLLENRKSEIGNRKEES